MFRLGRKYCNNLNNNNYTIVCSQPAVVNVELTMQLWPTFSFFLTIYSVKLMFKSCHFVVSLLAMKFLLNFAAIIVEDIT